MTRNGKIARLNSETRDQLNHRLENNEDGKTLLAWLNSLPDTKKILHEDFNDVPISKQNLSEWRLGGFREWQTRRELLHQASETTNHAEDLIVPEGRLLIDDVAIVLSARYAALLAGWDGEPDAKFTAKLRALGALVHDIVRLQRSVRRAHQHYLEEQAALDEANEQEMDATREDAVAQLLAPMNNKMQADMYGGGKGGEYLAGLVNAIRHDLPPPKPLTAADLAELGVSSQTQSKPVKPKNPVKPSPGAPPPVSPTPLSTSSNRGNEASTNTEPVLDNETTHVPHTRSSSSP